MSREQHRVLVGAAERWLRRRGFGVIGTEIFAAGCREQADAIGFRTNGTALVECKTSLADFRADAKKPERQHGGLGLYRFYLCPPGLITPEMLPLRWGLLWADRKKIEEVRAPQGNVWPAYNLQYPHGDWRPSCMPPIWKRSGSSCSRSPGVWRAGSRRPAADGGWR